MPTVAAVTGPIVPRFEEERMASRTAEMKGKMSGTKMGMFGL